ncbi:hypothetical protein D3C78_1427780 [compost metagenome]
MQQRRLLRARGEVDALLLRQHRVVGREPALDAVQRDGAFLAAQHGLVDVLDGLVHQGTEQHRALADGCELQFLEEAVLLGAVLEHGDVRGERVFALEVDLLDGLEGQRRQIHVTPTGQLVEQPLKVFGRRPAAPLFLLRR